LTFVWTANGSTVVQRISSVAITIADGATKWVRAVLDVDNGASGNDVIFYTSDDGTTWTQLGTTQTAAGITSIYSGTAPLEIGSIAVGTSGNARGKFFRAQVLNGIGGTVAFDANFESSIVGNLPTTFTEGSTNAATVTVNYSGTAYRSCGVIASTYVYPGATNTFSNSTIDYLNFGASDSFTLVAVVRQWATPGSFAGILTKESTSVYQGYRVANYGAALRHFVAIGLPEVSGVATTFTGGSLQTISGIINRTAQTITANQNGTSTTPVSITTVGTSASIETLKIGAYSGGGNNDMEFLGAAVFRNMLTLKNLADIYNYFNGRD
jgi:hypothetical protein